HMSNALKVRPIEAVRAALKSFSDDVYLHQVIQRDGEGRFKRYKDLPEALALALNDNNSATAEWRIHFHIPLHSRPTALFDTTADHLVAALDEMQKATLLWSPFEVETDTWGGMPAELKKR